MSYTDEQFIEAVKSSYSIAQILSKLNKIPSGGNYKTVKRLIKKFNLDVSHLLGQSYLKGKTYTKAPIFSNEEVFCKNSLYKGTTCNIKKRILKHGFLEKKCYSCNNTNWLSQEMPLELEHKNGDNNDNRLENLTLLCPNCHALTPTYRGKNKKK